MNGKRCWSALCLGSHLMAGCVFTIVQCQNFLPQKDCMRWGIMGCRFGRSSGCSLLKRRVIPLYFLPSVRLQVGWHHWMTIFFKQFVTMSRRCCWMKATLHHWLLLSVNKLLVHMFSVMEEEGGVVYTLHLSKLNALRLLSWLMRLICSGSKVSRIMRCDVFCWSSLSEEWFLALLILYIQLPRIQCLLRWSVFMQFMHCKRWTTQDWVK